MSDAKVALFVIGSLILAVLSKKAAREAAKGLGIPASAAGAAVGLLAQLLA